MRKTTALVCLAVVLTGCSTSGSLTGQTAKVDSAPSGKAASKDAAIGHALLVTGHDGLKVSVTLSSVTAHKTPASQYGQKPKNGLFMVAKFLIVDTAGAYDFNPLYLNWQTTDGTTYGALDGNGALAGFDPALSAGRLSAGQKTGGYVTFDVPAPHGIVQLTDPLGGVVGQWKT